MFKGISGAAVAALVASMTFNSNAQVLWKQTLNPPETEIATRSVATVSGLGGVLFVSSQHDGVELNGTRIAKHAANGQIEWTRWVDGRPLSNGDSLFSHTDGSVTQAYVSNQASRACFANFVANGVRRLQFCTTESENYAAAMRTADDEIVLANGSQRVYTKFALTGAERWRVTDSASTYSQWSGIGTDSSGNVFELRGGNLRRLRTSDGAQVSTAAFPGVENVYRADVRDRAVIPRTGDDFVVLTRVSITNNARVARLVRYASSGAVKWTRDAVFPTTEPFVAERVALFATTNDEVIVARMGANNTVGSELARISATGTIVSQRHIAQATSVVETSQGLVVTRRDVHASTSDSYVFPLSSVDGQLGAPIIYSRNDAFAPNGWYAAGNGVLAAFTIGAQESYPTALSAQTVYLTDAAASRWTSTAKAYPAARANPSSCLMPNLAKSNANSIWARVESPESPNSGTWIDRWRQRASATGAAQNDARIASRSCGFPMNDDGGQVIVSNSEQPRIRKVDANGTTLWQANAQVSPTQFGWPSVPLQSADGTGATVYAVGNVVGRINSAGSIVYETLTQSGSALFVATDAIGNATVVYSSSGSQAPVTRISASGTILSNTTLTAAGCNLQISAASKLANGDVVVAAQACSEGRVYRVGSSGSVQWQRVVSGTSSLPAARISALTEDANGNITAVGCVGESVSFVEPGVRTVAASWNAAGGERWSVATDLISGEKECATSVVGDSSGGAIVSTSSNSNTSPVLWSISATGQDRWRSAAALSAPNAFNAELLSDAGGNLFALGTSKADEQGAPLVSLRLLNTAGIAVTERIKFLQVPSASIAYRVPFNVRVGLRTASDQPQTASSAITVRLGLHQGNSALEGARECVIAVGASDCEIAGILFDGVESGIVLSAWADGMPAALSAPLQSSKAPTTTTLTLTPSTAPFVAFQVRKVRAQVTTPALVSPFAAGGYLNGPQENVYTYGQAFANCIAGELRNAVIGERTCDWLVRVANGGVRADYTNYGANIENSLANFVPSSIEKAAATLVVVADPDNTQVAGDRVRFRVRVNASGSFNATRYVNLPELAVSGGTCLSLATFPTNDFTSANDHWLCEVKALPAGSHSVTFNFTGNQDLIAASPVNVSVTQRAGAVIRGDYLPSNANLCSTNASVTCKALTTGQGEWQCVGPENASGEIFATTGSSSNVYYPESPIRFNNLSTAIESPALRFGFFQPSQCRLDVDGDGAIMAGTDGLMILRAMLGMSGSALNAGATHSCVPLTATGIRNNMTMQGYDLDGNGSFDAATDGLMLLRALLGFTDASVTNGAIGQNNPTRQDWATISQYLRSNCGFIR